MTPMVPVDPPHLETARLLLRAYAPGDGAMYAAVARKNQAHLRRYESENIILGAVDDTEGERLIGQIVESWQMGFYYFLGAFNKHSGEFVAQIYIGPVVHPHGLPDYEVGYFVDVDHEGQGYVSEAVRATLGWIFHSLGAQRASLRCNDTNLRSARVAERCGFTLEGHLRETRREADGSYSGDLIFGLLRREFIQ
jgi:RimJ/RimL family protein N-acetyltransferase